MAIIGQSSGPKTSAPEPARVAGPRQRVLVVEDNPDGNELLCAVLMKAGFRVEGTFDAASALTRAREFNPEVILCDIGLPGEMDGYDLAKRLRQEGSFGDTLLIAITGFGRDEDRKRALDNGFDAHLTKPVHVREIESVVHRLIESRRGR